MPDSTMSGVNYSSLGGVATSSNGDNLFTISTLRKDKGDDGTVLKMYARTGATSAQWYAEKFVILPLDRWFEFAHVVDISDKGEDADFPTYWYKQYIDGVPTVVTYNKQDRMPQTTDFTKNSYTGVPYKDGYFETFTGVMNRIAVAPGAEIAPVIYIDNVYAAMIEEYSPEFVSGQENVNPYSDIVLKFPAEFTAENAELLCKAISVERVSAYEGTITSVPEKGTFTVKFDENNNLVITPENGLKYNTDYLLKTDPSLATSKVEGIYDKQFMAVEKSELPFSTKKAEEVYINLDAGSLDLNGAQNIAEAESISYTMKLENETDSDKAVIVAMAVYGANNKLLKIDFSNVTVLKNDGKTAELEVTELGKKAEYVALYVFENNNNTPGVMLQIPDVLR